MLSDGFWKKHFGAQQEMVGKPLELNGESFTVIGVMPAWYHVPNRFEAESH